jgi:hypothetical protein
LNGLGACLEWIAQKWLRNFLKVSWKVEENREEPTEKSGRCREWFTTAEGDGGK